MNPSETGYPVRIHIQQSIPDLHLELLNGKMETVVQDKTSTLDLSLSQGVYQLKATYIDYYQEYFLSVEGPATFTLDFNYPSTSPVMNFCTTHEYYSVPAHQSSIHCTVPDKESVQPNFLLFGARYERNHRSEEDIETLLSCYSIYNNDHSVSFSLTAENTHKDDNDGLFTFSDELEPGMYFLHYTSETENRIFPFYLFEQFQTQFFIRYYERPDFSNCLFFYSEQMEFHRDNPAYVAFEKLQQAFNDMKYLNVLSANDLDIIHNTPYLNYLLRVLHVLHGKGYPENKEIPALYLPDLDILEQRRITHFGKAENVLPILTMVMHKQIAHSESEADVFANGSLADRIIDHLQPDIFWTNFSTIDLADNWKESLNAFFEPDYGLTQKPETKPAGLFRRLIQKNFSKLSATSPGKKDLAEKAAQFLQEKDRKKRLELIVERVPDLLEIAQKLNLPVPMVLRKYNQYKEIFNQLRQSEEQSESDH